MKVFLDDIRQPYDHTWTVVRNVDDFKKLIRSHKVLAISFDHDLGLENGTELPTGKDAANWLISHAMDYPVDIAGLSHIIIHSSNPPGAANIQGLIENAKKFGILPQSIKISKIPYESHKQ